MRESQCRMCWNSTQWVYPTGEAAGLESNTYVTKHGFGHEEWLFNLEWLLDDRKFGHLQPISRGRDSRVGEELQLSLHTIGPDKQRWAVGRIRRAEVISDAQAEFALGEFKRRGWLDQMASDLEELGLDPRPIISANAVSTFNVAFDPADLELNDPMLPLEAGDADYPASTRYTLTWAPAPTPRSSIGGSKGPTKSALETTRKAVAGTQVSLRHTRLQNALYQYLEARGDAVAYEAQHVDLTITKPRGAHLLEVKTAPSVRGCIRESLGQLLEYAHYGEPRAIISLVAVGRAYPTTSDLEYLDLLRSLYRIPLEYWRFSDAGGGAVEIYPQTL